MRTKLLLVARGGLSLWSNRKLTLSRLPLSRSPKWVSTQVNNCVVQSNIQCRGWSYAASVPSDKPNSQKGRRRVSRDERRAMVESFVNKYRATNAGKFPTISDTVKQVGGSYYVVRGIIQELKYTSKLNFSNSMDENLVDKECFNGGKLLTTETVKVLSGNTETAKDTPIQDDFQLAVLDETDAAHEHLEEKRGTQAASCERSLSKEAVITSAPSSHFIAAESNQLERDAEESSKVNLWTSVDAKREEAESHCSDSVAPKCHLPIEDIDHVYAPFNKNSGTSCVSAQSHESEFVDMEKCIEKIGYERREQAALKDLYEKHSQSSLQMASDVKTQEAESSYSDFVASEVHLIKEEIKHASAPFSEISGSSESKDHDSEFADRENHMVMGKTNIEKADYERREHDALEDLPGIDSPKHTTEQGRGSVEMNELKIDNSNREINDAEVPKKTKINDAEVPKKTTLWGNLKSLADGIMNIWRKF